jgi:hypothetical protein
LAIMGYSTFLRLKRLFATEPAGEFPQLIVAWPKMERVKSNPTTRHKIEIRCMIPSNLK